jgi:Leucine-rich repeat (LRR) protein
MSLSEEQIRWGYWNWPRAEKRIPEHITHFEDYRPGEVLVLNITQLDQVSSYHQNKIVEGWCRELPSLEGVKQLWFVSRVNQKMFDAACSMPDLESLFIKWSGIKSIEALRPAKSLRHLHLGSSSQVESIQVLGELEGLITLDLEQLNRISDFSAIASLTSLEGLGIDGSIWTAQKIDTLEPLANLRNLKYLTLTNTKIQDKSFDPLLGLNELVRFNSSWNYPESEFEKLKALPKLKYGNIETSWKELRAQLDKRFSSK